MNEKNFEGIYNQYLIQSEQPELTNQEDTSQKEEIVAVRKNEDGDIIAFKTKSGRELDYITALDEAKSGSIAHIDVFHKYGRDIIRSEPDGTLANNLSNLPEF